MDVSFDAGEMIREVSHGVVMVTTAHRAAYRCAVCPVYNGQAGGPISG
jgi:hypothetical protein